MKLYPQRLVILLPVCVCILIAFACEKGLDVTDPNNPTPDIVQSEEGLKRQSRGLWDSGNGWWEWILWSLHEHMGDNTVAPWDNFDWLWFYGNIERIEYSDGSQDWSPRLQATPSRSQAEWMEFINNRQTSQGGYEADWQFAYRLNNEANRILHALDEGVAFSGNAEAKEAAYRAWAHFWKGYGYSRVGLFYEQGLIVDEPDRTNNRFVSRGEMIAESRNQYRLALENASGFDLISADVIPAIFPTSVTAESFVQNIYTLMARNLLLSKRQTKMTATDWQQVRQWASQGLMDNQGALLFDSDESTHLSALTHRWRLATNVWARVSPRVVQILSENEDSRMSRFSFSGSGSNFTNLQVRPQLNSPWLTAVPSPYASSAPGTPQFMVSAEENKLMLAEAELGLGNPGEAGSWIDDVRSMPLQNAGLPPAGEATIVDIRNERKVALFGRALAFYDARRFGEIDAGDEGGGVFGVWVYHLDETNSLVLDPEANLYFDFLSWYKVPRHETDLNTPPASSAPSN